MLLHHAEEDFVLSDAWMLEIKYDGVRAIVDTRDEPIVYTRRGKEITAQFPEISIPKGLLLDGEIVGFEGDGFHRLNWVQRRLGVVNPEKIMERMRKFPITFVAFDYLNNLSLDYENRMVKLDELADKVTISPRHPAKDIDKMWAFIQKSHLEGLVAKRLDSTYVEGTRTYQWRKIKHEKPEYRA